MAGGGTGGHVMPSLAVATELRRRGHECVFVGTHTGMEAQLAPKHGFQIDWIEIGGLNRVGWGKAAATLPQLPVAVLQARLILKRRRAAAVFSMGGYVAGPVVAAAILSRTPIVAMEPNAMPGLVSRHTARWVRHALVSFEETELYFPRGRAERTPARPRRVLRHCTRCTVPAISRADHRRQPVAPGHSTGRPEAWPVLAQSPSTVTVTLQCGQAEADDLQAVFRGCGLGGEVVAFLDDMPAAYAEASLVVSRSGAGAVSEIAASGRPSILIPFPFAADDHQKHNALAMVRAGASAMIEDSELDGPRLAGEILRLVSDPPTAAKMGVSARALARPGAAQRAANLLEQCAGNIDSAADTPEQ